MAYQEQKFDNLTYTTFTDARDDGLFLYKNDDIFKGVVWPGVTAFPVSSSTVEGLKSLACLAGFAAHLQFIRAFANGSLLRLGLVPSKNAGLLDQRVPTVLQR